AAPTATGPPSCRAGAGFRPHRLDGEKPDGPLSDPKGVAVSAAQGVRMSGSSARPQPAATPAGAAPPGASSAAEQGRSLEDLAGHLARLEALHDQMARAELERLGELATLMRIAEALTCRRSFDEVLADC